MIIISKLEKKMILIETIQSHLLKIVDKIPDGMPELKPQIIKRLKELLFSAMNDYDTYIQNNKL